MSQTEQNYFLSGLGFIITVDCLPPLSSLTCTWDRPWGVVVTGECLTPLSSWICTWLSGDRPWRWWFPRHCGGPFTPRSAKVAMGCRCYGSPPSARIDKLDPQLPSSAKEAKTFSLLTSHAQLEKLTCASDPFTHYVIIERGVPCFKTQKMAA